MPRSPRLLEARRRKAAVFAAKQRSVKEQRFGSKNTQNIARNNLSQARRRSAQAQNNLNNPNATVTNRIALPNSSGGNTFVGNRTDGRTGQFKATQPQQNTRVNVEAPINTASTVGSFGKRGASQTQIEQLAQEQFRITAQEQQRQDFINNGGAPEVPQQDTGLPQKQVTDQGALDVKALEVPKRFAAVGQTASFQEALNNFRRENPGKDIILDNPELQRRSVSAAINANGADPTERFTQLFSNERFQTTAQKDVTTPLSNVFETSSGTVDTNAIKATTDTEVLQDYINSDTNIDYQKLLDDPDQFKDFTSADFIMQKFLGTKGLDQDILNQKLNSLLSQKTLISSFFDRANANAESSKKSDDALREKQKILAQQKIELEQIKLKAQKDKTLKPLKERQARLEGYLKMKFAANGMLADASGVGLLISQVQAFDDFVASTELGFSTASQDLALKGEDIMLQYSAQAIAAKRNFDDKILGFDQQLTNSLVSIEQNRVNSNVEKQIADNKALGDFLTQKQKAKEVLQSQKIDLWKETNRIIEKQKDRAMKETQRNIDTNNGFAKQFSDNFSKLIIESGVNITPDLLGGLNAIEQSVKSGAIGATVATAAASSLIAGDPNYQKFIQNKVKTAASKGFNFKELDNGNILISNKSDGTYRIANLDQGDTVDLPAVGSLKKGDVVPGWGAISVDGGASGQWQFGLDVLMSNGTKLPSNVSLGGTVVSVQNNTDGFGKSVKIKMPDTLGGEIHQYSHLSSINVSEGDIIQPNTLIGLTGNTGNVISNGKKPSLEERAKLAKEGKFPGSHLDFTVRDAQGRPKPVERAYQVMMRGGRGRYNISAKSAILDSKQKLVSPITPFEDLSSLTKAVINGSKITSITDPKERQRVVLEREMAGFILHPKITAKAINGAKDGLRQIAFLRKELFTDGKFNRAKLSFSQTKAFIFNDAIQTSLGDLADILTRERTGAALNQQELDFYQSLLPSIFNNDEDVDFKLKLFENIFKDVNNNSEWRRDPVEKSANLISQGATAFPKLNFAPDISEQDKLEARQEIMADPSIKEAFISGGVILK